jgi:signal transduction histidine kinase
VDNRTWSWPRVLVVSGLWLLYVLSSTAVEDVGVESASVIFTYALVGIVPAVGAGYAVYAVLSKVVRQTSRSVIIVTRAVSVSAGCSIAGVTVIALGSTGGYAYVLSPAIFIVVPALAGPLCMFGFDVIDESRAATLARREELISEAANLIATSASQEAIIADIRASILASVDAELAPVRADVARQLDLLRSDDIGKFEGNAGLQAAAHDSVRPLIDRLSSSSVATPPQIGFFGAILAIIRTQPFRPLLLSLIFVVAGVPQFSVSDDAIQTGASIAFGVVAIFVILGLANRAMKRRPERHAAIFIIGFIALQVPTVIDIATNSQQVPDAFIRAIATVTASAVVVLLTSGLTSWTSRQVVAQETFRELLDRERIESLARSRIAGEVAREAAQSLHGPVQARLAACAVAMQTASQTGNTDAYRDALRQAQATLDAPLLDIPTRSQHLHEILDAVAAPWRGLVNVEIDIQGTSVPTSVHAHLEKATEEAITNSVRHGRARVVHVTVWSQAGTTVVEVDDDGIGPAGGNPGLGATLLTRLSDGQWELNHSDALGGARLRVTIPTRL